MSCLLPAILFAATLAHAQNWNLSGKVIDAEEGNGLNTVEVSLARAGLRTTTAKNGTWTITGVVGVERAPDRLRRAESFLRVDGERILLRMGGVDIRGRHLDRSFGGVPSPAGAPRTLTAVDTLVYSKKGYVEKRVPLLSASLAGLLDSIRRVRGPEWVDSSHSNGFKPDTTDAFPDTLRTVLLRFTKANWDRMMKAMADSCGRFGTEPECAASDIDHVDNAALIWVPIDMETDGQTWKNVGIRLKGNNSLTTAWSRRQHALPFRVTMDRFEDSFPEIRNQRFHGFKKLSFNNATQDGSDIREAVAGEIFRDAGIPSPMSVPFHIKLVHGDTTKDLGAYEMVEIPDNPLLNRWFGNDSGPLYKPLSDLSTFKQAEFEDADLKTDYADVKALIAAINSGTRTSSPAAWRTELEKRIDMKGWIHWLALSNAIGNWDAYGVYPHNYYLFNDRGTFRWITYDIGWSLVEASDGFTWFTDPTEDGYVFTLIQNALADPVYCAEYKAWMTKSVADDGVFSAKRFQEKVDRYGKMVSSIPSTVAPVKELRSYTDTRHPQIRRLLAAHPCP